MILETITDIKRADEIVDIKGEAETLVPILQELNDDLQNNEKLLALSAPQIGHNIRVIALKFKDGIDFFINPLITKRKELTFSREKCITCGDQEYIIPRYNSIDVMFTKSSGYVSKLNLVGIAAFQFQQMFELIDGIQISDYGLPIDDDFDDLTEDEKIEILNGFRESLKELTTKLNDDIKNDDEALALKKNIDYYTTIAMSDKGPRPANRKERRLAEKRRRKLEKMLRKQEKAKNDRENKS